MHTGEPVPAPSVDTGEQSGGASEAYEDLFDVEFQVVLDEALYQTDLDSMRDEALAEDVLDEDTTAGQASQSIVSTASELGMSIPAILQGRYREDVYFRKVVNNIAGSTHFIYLDGLLYKLQDGSHLLCIPDVYGRTSCIREVILRHSHSILVHLGFRKTLGYLRTEVWWPEMVADTKAYCITCSVCATTKAVNAKPLGLLQPLPVPWQYIAMDFVGLLP